MTDISKLRRLVGGIPTTIDLSASGNVLQAYDFQLMNAAVSASLPLKLDSNKKFISGAIVLTSGSGEVTGQLSDSNLAQITTASKVAGSAVVVNAAGSIYDNSGLSLRLDGVTLTTTSSGLKVSDSQIDTTQLASGAATTDKIDIDGDLNVNNHKIVSLADPGDDATAATNKAYVDNAITGIYWKPPVLALVTAASLPGSPSTGDRYLLTDGSNVNKIATYGSSAWSYVAPSANWAAIASDTDSGYTYDATSGETFKWVQFTGAGQINAGVGLEKDGNTLSVLLGAGIVELPTHEVGIDLANNSGLELTSSSASGQLQVAPTLAGSGLTYSAGVLAVGAGAGLSVASDSIGLDSSVAGSGLTYSSGVVNVGAGEGMSVASDSIGLASSVAGSGLTYSSGVVNVGAGEGMSVASDSIGLDSSVAGSGLTYSSGVVNVGAGDGISVASDSVAVVASDLAGEGLTTDGSNNLKLDSSIAGDGLTYSSGILAVGAGEGMSVASDSIGLDSSVAGDGLTYSSGILAVGAGAGLTAASDSIAVGAGDGISVASDSVSLASTVAGNGLTYSSGVVAVGAGNGLSVASDSVSLASTTAGDGLTFSSGILAVGAGDGISVASDSVAVVASDLAGEGLTTDGSNNLKLDSSIAGNGLTYSSGVVAVGAGEGMSVASDSIGLDSSVAGDGLTYTSGVVAVGAGNGISVASDSVTLDLDGSSLTVGSDGLKVNADGVAGSMIRLANNEYLRARNAADGADVNVVKVNASDIIEFASFPITPSAAPDADYEVSNKKYVDDSIVAATPEKFQYKDQAAGEEFIANSTFVVRWALNGETAGRIYKATKDQENSPDKYWGIGVLQTTASLSVGDPCIVVKKGKLTLKSADTNFGASDNGKPIFLSTAGAFGTASPETGVGATDLYVSFIIGHVVSRSATTTSSVFEVDCNPGGLMGIDIA